MDPGRMIFNLVLLLLIFLALHLEGKDLGVFGFRPVGLRVLQFIVGVTLSVALSTFVNLLFAYAASFEWTRNELYPLDRLPTVFYKSFNSVVYEELIFRSYVLYKIHHWFGEKPAVLSTSIAFGMYHWFTMGVLGNVSMMVWIFFYTGLWGVMFAFCYTRTGSLLLATGLHWGWNFFDQVVFNKEGEGLVKPIMTDRTERLGNDIGFLIGTLPTVLFAVVIILYLIREKKIQI